MKKPIFLILLCFISSLSWAKDEFMQLKPSVNADMFKLPELSKNSLNEGQPTVSITLPSLQGKGYDLPISLSFYSGNITHLSDPSPMGLGWSLNAGGSLCVSVNDCPDIKTTNEIPWQFDGNYIENNYGTNISGPIMPISRMCTDLMPDNIEYNLPGHSGEIVEKIKPESGRVSIMVPDTEYSITFSELNGYCILDDKGNTFIFMPKDKEQTSVYFRKDNNYKDYATAWFLSEIRTSQGGFFSFEYEDETYTDYTSIADYRNGYIFNLKKTKRIRKIVSDYGYVEFGTENRSDVELSDIRKAIKSISYYSGSETSGAELTNKYVFDHDYISTQYVKTNTIMDFKDGSFDYGSPDGSFWRLSLKKIRIYGKDLQTESMPPYEFTYDSYFGHSRVNNSNNCWAVSTEKMFRAPYLYHSSDGRTVPYIGMTGFRENSRLIGFDDVPVYTDGSWDDYFVLTSLTYPTGLEESFIYEKHIAKNINEKIDLLFDKIIGRRLKEKRINNKVSIKYEYDGGTINNIPVQTTLLYSLSGGPHPDLPGCPSDVYFPKLVTNDYAVPFNSYIGNPVHYKNVKEIFVDELGNIKKSIEYKYSENTIVYPVNYVYSDFSGRRYLQKIENNIGRATDLGWNEEYLGKNVTALFAYPLAPLEAGEKSKLMQIKYYDEKARLVKKVKNTYASSVSDVRFGYKMIKNEEFGNGPFDEEWLISRYCHRSYDVFLKGTHTMEFFYNNEDKVPYDSLEEKVEYLNRTQNRVKEVRTTRLGQSSVTKTVYIDDIISKDNARTKNVNSVLNQMWTKNLLGLPIQTSVSRNGVTLNASFNVYGVSRYNQSKNARYDNWQYLVRLDSTLVYETTDHKQIAHPLIIGETIRHDTALQMNSYYLYNDNKDYQPRFVKKHGTPGMIIIWDNAQRHPIGVIKGWDGSTLDDMTLSGFSTLQNYTILKEGDLSRVKTTHLRVLDNVLYKNKNIECTTYTYNKEGQVTSISNSIGEMFFYFYDHAGRLSKVLDKDFNPVESYKYNYKEY